MATLADSKAVVLVFHMKGCDACEEYVPRFRRISKDYKARVPILILDVDSPEAAPYADQYKVTEMPSTIVLTRSGHGAFKASGNMENTEIIKVLNYAAGKNR